MSAMDDQLATLKAAVRHGGVRAGLRLINDLAGYRFTAMYRYDDDRLRNLFFFDREHPEQEVTADVPLDTTYCMLLLGVDGPLSITDAPRDPRLGDHPARTEVQAYCGVPLRSDAGTPIGSVCCFDVVPRPPLGDSVIALMQAMSALLVRPPPR